MVHHVHMRASPSRLRAAALRRRRRIASMQLRRSCVRDLHGIRRRQGWSRANAPVLRLRSPRLGLVRFGLLQLAVGAVALCTAVRGAAVLRHGRDCAVRVCIGSVSGRNERSLAGVCTCHPLIVPLLAPVDAERCEQAEQEAANDTTHACANGNIRRDPFLSLGTLRAVDAKRQMK